MQLYAFLLETHREDLHQSQVVVVVKDQTRKRAAEAAAKAKAKDPTALMAGVVPLKVVLLVVTLQKTLPPVVTLKKTLRRVRVEGPNLLSKPKEVMSSRRSRIPLKVVPTPLTPSISASPSESNFSYISTHILAYRLRFKFD